MNRSPLHETHEGLGARFVDFGGWEMPVQYGSVLAEHRAVRSTAGAFDVTHLGRFELTGPGARDAVRHLLCNDIDRIGPGRCQYSMMLNESGGIVDDLIVWWWDEERFWIMPNAVNQERVMSAFSEQPGCETADLQKGTVFLAVQGPHAPGLIEEVLGEAPGRFRCHSVSWGGEEVGMAGTGYTGERGGEICVAPDSARQLFQAFAAAGAAPCGLGARDTLRLEAGLALWGQDIDEMTTPLEAGLGFAVSYDHDFVGRNALLQQADSGVERLLVGFTLEERGIPRHGHPVKTESGGVGTVTSGNMSPMLQRGIGMAYVTPPPSIGEEMSVEIRGRPVTGHVAKPPFHLS